MLSAYDKLSVQYAHSRQENQFPMNRNTSLSIITLLLSAAFATSCSSDNDAMDEASSTKIYAAVTPEVITVDSCAISEEIYDSDTPVIYVDSVEFYSKLGPCVFEDLSKYDMQDICVDVTEINGDMSRATHRNFFDVSFRYNDKWNEVTILCGRLCVKYETSYLYEFPQHTNNLTIEYHISYDLNDNEYIGEKCVYRKGPFELAVAVDILTKNSSGNYNSRPAGMKVRIVDKKFQLMEMTGCD